MLSLGSFQNVHKDFALRHIYANFKLAGHKGTDLKKIVDHAAYAWEKHDFDMAMEKLKEGSEEAWQWLSNIPTMYWARHALDTTCTTKHAGKRKKNRIKGVDETIAPSRGRMTTITCSNCKLHGHRYTSCKQTLKPHLLMRRQKHKPPPPQAAPQPPRQHATQPAAREAPPCSASTQPGASSSRPSTVTHGPTREKIATVRGRGRGTPLGVAGYVRLMSYFTASGNVH